MMTMPELKTKSKPKPKNKPNTIKQEIVELRQLQDVCLFCEGSKELKKSLYILLQNPIHHSNSDVCSTIWNC